jgi:hypothetical protein
VVWGGGVEAGIFLIQKVHEFVFKAIIIYRWAALSHPTKSASTKNTTSCSPSTTPTTDR